MIGLALTRMRENAMAMATIGVLVILFVVFDNWEGITRGATGLFGIPRSTTVWSALVFAVVTIAICRFFRESNPGLELRASRTDSLAAEALGSNVVRLRWWAWTLSGALMGMGGGLWAQYNAFGPRQFFFAITFSLLAMLVVGGLGSVSGAVIRAFVVTAVFEVMRRIEDGSTCRDHADRRCARDPARPVPQAERPDGPLGGRRRARETIQPATSLRKPNTARLNSSGYSQRHAWPPAHDPRRAGELVVEAP